MHADTAHQQWQAWCWRALCHDHARRVQQQRPMHRVTTEYAASLAQQSPHYEPPATGCHLCSLQSWQRSTLARSEERDAARVSRHARVTRQPLLAREVALEHGTWNLEVNLESNDFVQKSRCTYPDQTFKQLLTSRLIRSLLICCWLTRVPTLYAPWS